MALDVKAIALRGRWVRHGVPGAPALPRRDPPPDNRWQRGHVVDALYLADCEDTAWAEWYRHLAERAIPPLAQMPRAMWRWEIDVRVADLSTSKRLDAVGLVAPSPTARAWRAYQRVGELLFQEGWHGLVAASAARPTGRVLCLFRNAGSVGGAQPLSPPTLVSEPPPPPTGLRT